VSSSEDVPRSRDGAPNWAADTDPVGAVTPELALVDPALNSGSGHFNSEVSMSSMQFGDGSLGAPEPAPAPLDGLQSPPLEPIPSLAPVAPEPAPPVPAEAAPPGLTVADMRDVPLGTLIFRAGLLPEEKLEEALQEGIKSGKRLGEVLLERGLVSENDLGRLLAGQKGLPFVELDPSAVDPTAPPLLHPEKARLHSALPIGFESGVPVVAVTDPSNDLVVENVRRALNCEPVLVVAGRDALHRTIDAVYGGTPQPVAPPVAPPVEAPVAETPVAEHSVAAPPVPEQPVVPEPVAVEPIAPVAEPVVEVPAVPVVEPAPAVPVIQPDSLAVEPELVAPPAVDPQPVAETSVPAVPVVEPLAVQPAQNGDGVWLGHVDEAAPAVPVEPQPVAPEPVFEPVAEPIQAVEPVQQQSVEPIQPVEPLQAFEPVQPVEPVAPAEPVLPVEPVAPIPEPVAVEPVAVEPVQPDPTPVEQPSVEEPAAGPAYAVEVRLSNGEHIEVGLFGSHDEAVEGARDIVAQASSGNATWPFLDGRFLRPDAIVSVDLVRQDAERWLGSSARAAAWTPKPAEQ
jgi:hypothetical protein